MTDQPRNQNPTTVQAPVIGGHERSANIIMIRLLCTIISLLAASIALSDNVHVGKLRFQLPDQFHHEPAKGIDSSSGTFRHTGDGFEIHYDIGIIGIGKVGDIAKGFRARWPDKIERDEVLKTALGKGELIVFDLGTGTKMASFEAAPGVTFSANIGTGAHLEDFIKIVRSIQSVPASEDSSKAEQPDADQPATKPADKAPMKDQPSSPTPNDVPHKAEQVVDGKPPSAPQPPR